MHYSGYPPDVLTMNEYVFRLGIPADGYAFYYTVMASDVQSAIKKVRREHPSLEIYAIFEKLFGSTSCMPLGKGEERLTAF